MPQYASFVFPCFDQIGLIPSIELFIVCDSDITLISNTIKKEVQANLIAENNLYDTDKLNLNNRKIKINHFSDINLPSYNLFIGGGNIISVTDEFSKDPELTIHLYKENKENANPIEIFMIIRDSINFFNAKFHNTTNYEKIDILFLPNVTPTSYPGVIILDNKFIEQHVDCIDKNYFGILLSNASMNLLLNRLFFFSWWDDVYFFQAMSIFLGNLFFKEKLTKKSGIEKYLDTYLMYDFFKSKAIIANKNENSHPVRMEINDSEEAELFYDEITIFKNFSLIKYVYNLEKELFENSFRAFIDSKKFQFIKIDDFYGIYSHSDVNSKNEILFPMNQLSNYMTNNKLPSLYYVFIF